MTAEMIDSVPGDPAPSRAGCRIALPHTRMHTDPNARVQLVLATGAFFVCFAAYGSVGAMMPLAIERMGLSAGQVGFALAVPALLGSAGRLPLGMLSDRLGGRVIYIGVMALSIVPAVLLGCAASYWQILLGTLLSGLPLAVFPVGVAFISNWYPPHRHGAAFGFMTFGSIGHTLALLGAPRAAHWFGYSWGFWSFGLLLVGWLIVFIVLAEDAPAPALPILKKLTNLGSPLRQPASWELSTFYFLTMGCFLSLSAFLPRLLTSQFHLGISDAGLRTAGFVTLATLSRPVGGICADRIGGRVILLAGFPAVALSALLMANSHIGVFTVGALTLAVGIGFGSGAIFKLVPHYFPDSVGSATGLVGAAGGLGGFFPPIALGVFQKTTGSVTPGFVLLSTFALCCFAICLKSRPVRCGHVAIAAE